MATAEKVGRRRTHDRFVRLIDRLVNESPKSQREIASDMGFERQNIITMLKQGTTRMPLDRVERFALSMDRDPAELVRLWMEEYAPDHLKVLDKNIGMTMSSAERQWISRMRRLFEDGVPEWDEGWEQTLRDRARRTGVVLREQREHA